MISTAGSQHGQPMRSGSPLPVIIGIDGRSGAGKTTLALELAALLREHHKVTVFHLEDIYPGWNGLAAGVERYVSTVLTPLRNGLPAQWISWDWDNHYDGALHVTEPAEIVIMEGVGAAHSSAAPLLDVVIRVEAPADHRKARAIARDGETFAPFWDAWSVQEDELLGTIEDEAADLLVQGRTDDSTPGQVLLALTSLPPLDALLAPERARRRGLALQVHRVEAYPDQERLFGSLYGGSAHSVWLDSSNATAVRATGPGDADGPDNAGGPGDTDDADGWSDDPGTRSRFSIMADDGGAYGQYARHGGGVTRISSGAVTARTPGPFFRWLDTVWGRRAVRAPDDYVCGFTLGWLGYLGYELKRETGGADAAGPGTAGRPDDAALIFAGRAVVIDHAQRCVYLLTLAGESDAVDPADQATSEADVWLAAARAAIAVHSGGRQAPDRLPADGQDPDGQTPQGQAAPGQVDDQPAPGQAVDQPAPVFTCRDTEIQYKAKIARAQAEIADGNSYEICLTTALTARPAAGMDPWRTYRQLRRGNPAPFASYLHFDNVSIAGTSPERFLRITADGTMRAEPIKGTRRRDADPARDAALKAALENSAKDRAENIMIVDLLRNDLAHFAVPDSLAVRRLCAVESYATVHQMVSTIEAQLRPGATRTEAVAAAFPAGSMTGAPKISTMAILDELEGAPRGVYSGAVGYFSLNGAADLAVTIRTLVLETTDDGDRLSLGVGGAITADSAPHEEWLEVQAKAYGVLKAIGTVFPN
ncbi:chorismate-binding protein [Paeniglutamicibacter antarcticus]|uniref:Chorismate-binding protein n=1 Tax=Arthrobacter terrae TaxID=2935737 RepID=A0A931CU19_9MICC|nr:chorismate-binding protein [Arthrobacter terrae]MBG0740911.1 chorismate-binding protein [Arthrobacter terrae]